jgi:nucleotide-binding universal stress UspA family protein
MNPSLLFAQNGKPIFCTNNKMMKIFIPVDFSISSTNAVHYASKLADKLHAEIVLLHVVFMEGPPHAAMLNTHYVEEVIAASANRDCLQLIQELKAENKDLHVSHVVIKGYPLAAVIEEYAVTYGCDLIVIGTKGASGVAKVLMGSNAAAVISNSSIPVITVPGQATFKTIKQIVYASDLTAVQPEMKTLLRFARLFDATLHILHIIPPGSAIPADRTKIKQALIARYKYPRITVHYYFHEDVKEGIEEFLLKSKGDLLALFSHKPSFFEKLFGKSVTRELSFHSMTPLLSIRKRTAMKTKKVSDVTYAAP